MNNHDSGGFYRCEVFKFNNVRLLKSKQNALKKVYFKSASDTFARNIVVMNDKAIAMSSEDY